jgi:hypothetical protein
MSFTRSIHSYLRRKAGAFFSGYTDEALLDYILFHLQRRQLVAAMGLGGCRGVLVGWRQASPVPVPFVWQEPDPAGGTVHWDLFVADTTTAALSMVACLLKNHPELARLPGCAWRRDKVRHYPPGHVLRLYRKREHYGYQSISANT